MTAPRVSVVRGPRGSCLHPSTSLPPLHCSETDSLPLSRSMICPDRWAHIWMLHPESSLQPQYHLNLPASVLKFPTVNESWSHRRGRKVPHWEAWRADPSVANICSLGPRRTESPHSHLPALLPSCLAPLQGLRSGCWPSCSAGQLPRGHPAPLPDRLRARGQA